MLLSWLGRQVLPPPRGTRAHSCLTAREPPGTLAAAYPASPAAKRTLPGELEIPATYRGIYIQLAPELSPYFWSWESISMIDNELIKGKILSSSPSPPPALSSHSPTSSPLTCFFFFALFPLPLTSFSSSL